MNLRERLYRLFLKKQAIKTSNTAIYRKQKQSVIEYLTREFQADCKSIGDLLGIAVFNNFVDKYIPNSIFTIISGHTNGVLCTVLSFVVVGILVMFLFYLIYCF